MLEKPLGMETEMSQCPCLHQPAPDIYNQTLRQRGLKGVRGDRKGEDEEGGWRWSVRGQFE